MADCATVRLTIQCCVAVKRPLKQISVFSVKFNTFHENFKDYFIQFAEFFSLRCLAVAQL